MTARVNEPASAEAPYEKILGLILDGTYPPGAPLRLQELSAQVGTSITPIRQALRDLEAIGLVQSVRHHGAQVRPVSVADMVDTYRTRILLEGELCRLAAQTFTAEDDAKAVAALEKQRQALEAGDHAAARRHHRDMHYAIYEASGSIWLVRSTRQAWMNSERYRVQSEAGKDMLTSRRDEHEALLEACRRHDPEGAKQAITDHLLSTVAHFDPSVERRLRILLG